eukprot:TRINITY_DN427_c0_g1_i1.p1 TRINITY_DN427_c0_g1~~TRINITY_DN427_c0_g1_i1.p1  ORF type:complete len:785 (-),score=365.81 TRINITY_DN427_c0_g1_i1:47-2401(-)
MKSQQARNQPQRRRENELERRKRPLLLRPAYFALDSSRSMALVGVRFVLHLFAVFLGVVGWITATDPKELLSLQFGSPKGKSKASHSFTDRLKEAANGVLPHSGEIEALKGQLNASRLLIAKLESEAAERQLQNMNLAANLVVDQIAHEIHPDPRDELEVEQKLLNLLQARMRDTREAEEYKRAAESQTVYYNGVIESLRGDLLKELEVIEHQQEDKASLEKKVEIAKNVIDTLKDKLAAEEARREEVVKAQKLKFKEQQDRITEEFKTATDFCKDLRRKLEAESKHKTLLAERSKELESQLESYKEQLEEFTQKNKEMAVALNEEKNQLALIKKERDLEAQKFQETSQHLKESLTKETNRVVVIQNKSAEEKSKLLEENNRQMQKLQKDFKKELAEAQHALEDERKRHAAEHKISHDVIEALKIKDTDDVQKEKMKWESELKKAKVQYDHLTEQLNKKLLRREEENAALALLQQTMKQQYEEEKSRVAAVEKELAELHNQIDTLQKERDRLSRELNQASRDLEFEKSSTASKVDSERVTVERRNAEKLREANQSHSEEVKKLQKELNQQKHLVEQTEGRLEQTKKELVARLTTSEKEKSQIAKDARDTERLLKSKEQTLQETLRLQEAASQRVVALSASLQEEQKKLQVLQDRLAQETKARSAEQLQFKKDTEYLEKEVVVAKNLIETLKTAYKSERESNAELKEGWEADKKSTENQVQQLKSTLAKENENISQDKLKITQLETENKGLSSRNSSLKQDLEVTSKTEQVEKVVHEEVNTVQSI